MGRKDKRVLAEERGESEEASDGAEWARESPGLPAQRTFCALMGFSLALGAGGAAIAANHTARGGLFAVAREMASDLPVDLVDPSFSEPLEHYLAEMMGASSAMGGNAEDLLLGDVTPCCEGEERWPKQGRGLCYASCANLTFGTHPFRTSPWSCCSQADRTLCGFFHIANVNFSVGLCAGFDVGNCQLPRACPHMQGKCLPDEEPFLGHCYRSCSNLTDGAYTHRVSALTCCRVQLGLNLDCILQSSTREKYNVGSLLVDDDGNPRTPSRPHPLILPAVGGAAAAAGGRAGSRGRHRQGWLSSLKPRSSLGAVGTR